MGPAKVGAAAVEANGAIGMKRCISAPVLDALGVDTDGASPSDFERHWNCALGCKTNEVALGLLAQVVALEHLDTATATEEQIDLGTHRLAMTFLMRVSLQDQSRYGRDSNIQRASRLMRLFIEQLGAMAKLKGQTGQQRVVVEHVTVANGGQAIVGAITQGGGMGRRLLTTE